MRSSINGVELKPILSDFITQQRIAAVLPFLKGNILDLGCGYTKIPSLLHPDQRYVGIDHNPTIDQWGLDHFPQHQFYRYDLETEAILGLPKFDTILMLAVLEHLEDPGRILQQISRLLTPLGKLVITTPTPFGGKIHTIGTYLGLFYKEAREDHKMFYCKDELLRTLRNNHFSISLYRKFLFAGNQLIVCSFQSQV